MSLPDYYKILEISPTATPAQIREAYKKAALKYHPDRVPSDSPERPARTKKFQEINDAYYTLSDPTRRRDYDSARSYSTPDETPPGGFPWSSFGFGAKTEQEEERFRNEQFGDVFEDMLREEGMATDDHRPTGKFWSIVGGLSGGALGFIVANFPGAVAGSIAGNRLGAVRDAKGKSVYAVFQDLPQEDKARMLSQLAAKGFDGIQGWTDTTEAAVFEPFCSLFKKGFAENFLDKPRTYLLDLESTILNCLFHRFRFHNEHLRKTTKMCHENFSIATECRKFPPHAVRLTPEPIRCKAFCKRALEAYRKRFGLCRSSMSPDGRKLLYHPEEEAWLRKYTATRSCTDKTDRSGNLILDRRLKYAKGMCKRCVSSTDTKPPLSSTAGVKGPLKEQADKEQDQEEEAVCMEYEETNTLGIGQEDILLPCTYKPEVESSSIARVDRWAAGVAAAGQPASPASFIEARAKTHTNSHPYVQESCTIDYRNGYSEPQRASPENSNSSHTMREGNPPGRFETGELRPSQGERRSTFRTGYSIRGHETSPPGNITAYKHVPQGCGSRAGYDDLTRSGVSDSRSPSSEQSRDSSYSCHSRYVPITISHSVAAETLSQRGSSYSARKGAR